MNRVASTNVTGHASLRRLVWPMAVNAFAPALALAIPTLLKTGPLNHSAAAAPDILLSYTLLAAPLWLALVASWLLNATHAVTGGAMSAGYALLFWVAYRVASAITPEAANGWLFYVLGSPLAFIAGAVAGSVASRFRASAA